MSVRSWIGCVVVALVCLLGPSAAGAVPPVSSPGSPTNDLGAAIGSDGNRLWFAKVFQDRKSKVFTQVFELKNGRWKAISRKFPSSNNFAVQLEALNRPGRIRPVPCLAFSGRKSEIRVLCLEKRRWRSKPLPKSLARMSFSGMRATGHTLTAVFGDGDLKSTQIRVARLKGDGFVPTGPGLTIKGQSYLTLGQATDDAPQGLVDVGLVDLTRDGHEKRQVVTLKGDRWIRTKAFTEGGGGNLSGPVRTKRQLLVPVNEGLEDRESGRFWTTSVYEYSNRNWSSVGTGPISKDLGHAQGGIFAVGNEVWAAWEENDFSAITDFGEPGPSWQFAARLGSSGKAFERPVELWHGKMSFPGPVQVVEYRGRPAFMYFRQSEAYVLRATVDLRPR